MARSRNSSHPRRRAPSAAAVLLLAATAAVMSGAGPQGASARPLRDPNNPLPAPDSFQAAQTYHAETAVPGSAESSMAAGHAGPYGPGQHQYHPEQQQQQQQQQQQYQQGQPSYGTGSNYAVAGGASRRDGYAASATGGAVGALWPQAMANAAAVGGGPFSGPYGGYGGGMYGRNGFFYGRDRTQWPNHSAGSMAIAGGQTAAIASTGKASAAAFGGRRRLAGREPRV